MRGLLLALLLLAGCDGDTLQDLTIVKQDGTMVHLKVEIAADMETRARGLMHRTALAIDHGMLFVFPATAMQTFWMRDTLIPLDIIFINDKGRIVHIHDRAKPHDETPVSSRFPVLQVLEVNGGMAQRWGLQAGDAIKVAEAAALN